MSAAEITQVPAGQLGDHLADALHDGGQRHHTYADLRAVRAEVRPGTRPGILSVKVIYEQESRCGD